MIGDVIKESSNKCHEGVRGMWTDLPLNPMTHSDIDGFPSRGSNTDEMEFGPRINWYARDG
jgi:hypothetical protein